MAVKPGSSLKPSYINSKFSSIDASAEYWKYSGRSRYQTKNCGESQAKAIWIGNLAQEVGVAGSHTSPTTRWHSKSSPRMEPLGNQTPEQHGAEQSSKRLDIKAKDGEKSKYSPKTVSDGETLWGLYVPSWNDGKLYIPAATLVCKLGTELLKSLH